MRTVPVRRRQTPRMATTLTPAAALDWAFATPRTAKLAVVLGSGAPLVAPVWVGAALAAAGLVIALASFRADARRPAAVLA